jgi:hypothetical protein
MNAKKILVSVAIGFAIIAAYNYVKSNFSFMSWLP